jgi:hypothetical protein
MNKGIVKKTLLVSGIFLSIVNASIYGCDGPCRNMNSDCGDVGGGMGTCHVEYPPEGGSWGCSGQCTSYCPSGSPDQFCEGVSGSCSTSVGTCSRMITYSCYTVMYGPPSCVCEVSGGGPNCPRQSC